jgi:hypothetical protein
VTHPEISLEDLTWLASADGEAAIAVAHQSSQPLHTKIAAARKLFGAARASLTVGQIELRLRAQKKFGDWSDRLIWTETLLQQSTDRDVAAYKATRFGVNDLVLDLCCGAGGDFFALAARGSCIGYDLSPAAAFLARENAKRLGLHADTVCAEASTAPITEANAWHIDPDRRASDSRTSKLEFASPSASVIRELLAKNPNACIKSAPADRECELASDETEMEWIGSRGECRQLAIWCGSLARHPGKRVATIVEHADHSVVGEPHAPIEFAESIGAYIHEPHNAVLGAELENVLANSQQAKRLDSNAAYFSSEIPSTHPALLSYQVHDALPFDVKTLKQWIRAKSIGTVEIKKRGVLIDPAKLRKQLAPEGDNNATLLLTPHAGRVLALHVERV